MGQHDEHHHTQGQQGDQEDPRFPGGVEDPVEPEQGHTQKAADDGADETVAPLLPGVAHVAAHAIDGADAGKGGVPADEKVEGGAQGGGKGRLEVAQAHAGQLKLGLLLHGDLRRNI